MTREHEALQQIYQSTRGYCHRCRRKLAFSAYARAAARGAWGIAAGVLQPTCTTCLTEHVPRARSMHTLLGGLLGAFLAGPWGALLGSLLGAEVDEC